MLFKKIILSCLCLHVFLNPKVVCVVYFSDAKHSLSVKTVRRIIAYYSTAAFSEVEHSIRFIQSNFVLIDFCRFPSSVRMSLKPNFKLKKHSSLKKKGMGK